MVSRAQRELYCFMMTDGLELQTSQWSQNLEHFMLTFRLTPMAVRKRQDREKWLVAVLQSIAYGVVATDEQWRIQFMNPAAESLTGWLADDAIGRELGEVLRVSISSPRPLDTESGPLRGGKAEGVLDCLNGTALLIEETSTTIRDDRGRVIGSVIAIREISPRTAT
jgi:PAS domain S-box-containing protein